MRLPKTFLAIAAFGVSSLCPAATECDQFIWMASDAVNLNWDAGPIFIDAFDNQKLLSKEIAPGRLAKDVNDGDMEGIFEKVNACLAATKYYKFESSGYQLTDAQKQHYRNYVRRYKLAIDLRNQLAVETTLTNGMSFSCIDIYKHENARKYRDSIINPGTILGKSLTSYTDADFDLVGTKLDQCKLLAKNAEGVKVDDRFINKFEEFGNSLAAWKDVKSAFAVAEESERKEQIVQAEVSEKKQNPPWIVKTLDWIVKTIGGIGVLAVAIGSFGFVKRDKRFKTGRKNNEDDAPWAVQLAKVGFILVLTSTAYIFLAIKFLNI